MLPTVMLFVVSSYVVPEVTISRDMLGFCTACEVKRPRPKSTGTAAAVANTAPESRIRVWLIMRKFVTLSPRYRARHTAGGTDNKLWHHNRSPKSTDVGRRDKKTGSLEDNASCDPGRRNTRPEWPILTRNSQLRRCHFPLRLRCPFR